MDELSREQSDILKSIEERIAELKKVKESLLKCQRDMDSMGRELRLVRKHNDRLLQILKECGAKLCEKCGEHEAKCCGCKFNGFKDMNLD